MTDENKKETKKADAKSEETVVRIEAIGPSDDTLLSGVLRYPRLKGNKTIDIYKGQILTVGQDISEEEADQLKELEIWKFKEVKE